MFNKLKEYIKALFERDRCRFSKSCKLYKKDSLVCNDLFERFPTDDKAYCGKYRKLNND